MKALLAAAALALALSSAAPAATKPVRFHTLAKSDGSSSSVTQRKNVVIRRSETYLFYWRRLHAGQNPAPRAPKVDFRRNMVILVLQGTRSSGGHSIAVDRITDSGKRTTVSVAESAPGPDCFTTQQVTSPFHMVRIRKTKDRVRFTHRSALAGC